MKLSVATRLSCNETQSETMFQLWSIRQISQSTPPPAGPGRGMALAGAVAVMAVLAAGCASGPKTANAANSTSVINAIGAENEYANVLGQIGGRYVHVTAILDNPNTDPHTFEASPSVAAEISSADLVVQNGVGYDSWINRMEAAAPNAKRKVIVVQHLLGLPDSTPNPHLWYDPKTMPAGGEGDGHRPGGAAARARRLLPGQPEDLRPLADPLADRHRPRSRRSTPASRSPPPSRSPTTCCRPWGPTTSPRSPSRPTS